MDANLEAWNAEFEALLAELAQGMRDFEERDQPSLNEVLADLVKKPPRRRRRRA